MDHSILQQLRTWIDLLYKLPSIPTRIRQELGELRALRADVTRLLDAVDFPESHRLSSELTTTPLRPELKQCAEMLARLPEQLQEHSLIIETALRAPLQAHAESILQSHLVACTERTAGLSVLVPCWNHGGLLGRAVESALHSLDQLKTPGEVIILDDASRDESRGVARAWTKRDARVRLIESDSNLGLARARNTLLRQAKHHHAMLLDADNQLIAEGVAALYDSACQSGAVLAYGTIIAVDEHNEAVGVMSHRPITPELAERNWVDAMAMVHTQRLLELGGYEADQLTALCDWELVLRLVRLGEPIVHVPTQVGIYRSSHLSMIHDAVDTQRVRRLKRMYAIDGPPHLDDLVTAVHHPATGYLWRSKAWNSTQSPIQQQWNTLEPNSGRYLVVTSAGVRNHGDDAILLSTLNRLSQVRPEAEVIVVSDGADIPPLGRRALWAGTCQEICHMLDPSQIQRGCSGYPTLAEQVARTVAAKGTPASYTIDFSSLDAVLFAGGGNLASYWPVLTAWRTALAAVARANNVPYLFTGQGVGPLDETVSPLVRFLAENATRFATRDAVSAELLRANVQPGTRIEVVGDDALGIAAEDDHSLRRWLAEIGVPNNMPLLGFHAREANYTGVDRETMIGHTRAVDELARLTGHAVVCLPINSQPQAPEVELLATLAAQGQSLAPWYVPDASDDPHRVVGLIQHCSAVVTHSFHIALHAMESHIPTLLVAATEYYDRKARGLEHSFGTPASITISPHASPTTMLHRLAQLKNEPWSPKATTETVDSWLDEALPSLKQQSKNAAA